MKCQNCWFQVEVGVHQSSVLNLLFFADVMNALTDHLIRTKKELLYADKLFLLKITENKWKRNMLNEKKAFKIIGLKANVNDIKE